LGKKRREREREREQKEGFRMFGKYSFGTDLVQRKGLN